MICNKVKIILTENTVSFAVDKVISKITKPFNEYNEQYFSDVLKTEQKYYTLL